MPVTGSGTALLRMTVLPPRSITLSAPDPVSGAGVHSGNAVVLPLSTLAIASRSEQPWLKGGSGISPDTSHPGLGLLPFLLQFFSSTAVVTLMVTVAFAGMAVTSATSAIQR